MADHPTSATATRDRATAKRLGPWAAGLVLGIVLLGPDLLPGPIFTLDQVLPDQVPVPPGVWGLGPELPRRVPLWAPVAWLSPVIGGATAGKFLMLATIVMAFVGAYRLTLRVAPDESGSVIGAGAAGLLYAASPFLMTRLAVGHLMVAVPMALLPWFLPVLIRPDRDLARTYVAVFAIAFGGHFGGLLAALVVGVGLLERRGRRAPAVIAITILAQLPWLLPGLVVARGGGDLAGALPFSTSAPGLEGAGALLAGHGFWLPVYQVGHDSGGLVAVAGIFLVVLAVLGTRLVRADVRRPLVIMAAIGLAVAAASAIPGVRDLYASATDNPIASLLRESQRLLVPYLLWLAIAAPIGAHAVGARLRDPVASAVVQAVPLALAAGLALPALWGIDPRMHPLSLPSEWAQMREIITDAPGTVAALPWHQYFDLGVDGNGKRRVLNPLPIDLGGDVLASTDPELGAPAHEGVDPRERVMDEIVSGARRGVPVSDRLARLGVRWVVVLHQSDWAGYRGISAADPGLRVALAAPTLDLYEVRGWAGLVVDHDGRAVEATSSFDPLVDVAASGPARYARPAADGWRRGGEAAGRTDDGLVALPAGSGLVWYWPALLVLAGDAVSLVGLGGALVAQRRGRGANAATPESVFRHAPRSPQNR